MENNMIKNEIQIEAQREKLDELLDMIRIDLNLMCCPMDKQISLEICIEEIFVNIASYAYGEQTHLPKVERVSTIVAFRP